MKALPWIVAGIGVGLTAYIVLTNPELRCATGIDEIEKAARKTFGWGTKQRWAGTGNQVVGKIKENLGRVAGNDDLAGEGLVDQVAGAAKNTAGGIAQAAGETIHDLNR